MDKKVLLITGRPAKNPDSLNGAGLQEWLTRELGDGWNVSMTSLSKLVYRVGRETRIYDPAQGFDIAEFDLVVFRTVGSELELGIAAATYLQAKAVRFVDPYLLMPAKGKLACSFTRWANGLPVPETVYVRPSRLMATLTEQGVDYPLVLKADIAKKGRDNYLVKNASELSKRLAEATGVMLAQPMIPNSGDYRLLVIDGRVSLVLHRRAQPGSHLNNVSTGGSAKLVALDTVPAKLLDLAVRAAELEKLAVAGVDVIVDRGTGTPFVLEVNRAPQLATGAFADEKMAAYATGIKTMATALSQPMRIPIGRAEHVRLPDHGDGAVPAKIDSGAFSSSICASNVVVVDDVLSFSLFTKGSPYYNGKRFSFPKGSYFRISVENSFGDREIRYAVRLRIQIHGRIVTTLFTLADRSKKIYPILLGRRLLRHGYVIDVTTGTPLTNEERHHRQLRKVALRENED